MAITNYTELQSALADWLNRPDLEQRIPDFIALAESTLNRVLRDGEMVTTDTVVVTSGTATLPITAQEIVYAQVTGDTAAPLEQVSPQQLLMLRRNRLRAAGTPRFFAVVGRQVRVAPIPASPTSIDVTNYRSIPALSVGSPTNWLLTKAPHIYLYTSLLHAMPFLQDSARAQVMQQTVAQQIVEAVKADQALTFDDLRSPGFSLSSPADAGAAAAPVVG